jgi:hypothetical protein
MTDSQTERFWQNLLAYTDQGKVVPVIGRELLVVEHEGRPELLMNLLAMRLADELRAYGELDGTRHHIRPRACTISKVIVWPSRKSCRPCARANPALPSWTATGRACCAS